MSDASEIGRNHIHHTKPIANDETVLFVLFANPKLVSVSPNPDPVWTLYPKRIRFRARESPYRSARRSGIVE